MYRWQERPLEAKGLSLKPSRSKSSLTRAPSSQGATPLTILLFFLVSIHESTPLHSHLLSRFRPRHIIQTPGFKHVVPPAWKFGWLIQGSDVPCSPSLEYLPPPHPHPCHYESTVFFSPTALAVLCNHLTYSRLHWLSLPPECKLSGVRGQGFFVSCGIPSTFDSAFYITGVQTIYWMNKWMNSQLDYFNGLLILLFSCFSMRRGLRETGWHVVYHWTKSRRTKFSLNKILRKEGTQGQLWGQRNGGWLAQWPDRVRGPGLWCQLASWCVALSSSPPLSIYLSLLEKWW